MAIDPAIGPSTGGANFIDSLSCFRPTELFEQAFVVMRDTSAATARRPGWPPPASTLSVGRKPFVPLSFIPPSGRMR